MNELETCLAQQAPPQQPDNPALHELPPLVIDGIPTPVDKMTQAQLRAFIPEMLKYSTGRSKPGWGKMECRPLWWPADVPWANVRSDVRTEEQKKKVSWTHALRTIVCNCYRHHGRDDLLPDFHDHDPGIALQHQTMVQTINNPDGTLSIIQIDTGDVNNPQVVTLADGTQAHVVHTVNPGGVEQQVLQFQPWHVVGKTEEHQLLNGSTATVIQQPTQQEATQAVQTLAEVAAHQADIPGATGIPNQNVAVEVNSDTVAQLAEATLNHDGHIILTSDAANALGGDALSNLFVKNVNGQTLSGMVTIPVSMYQTVVTSIAQMNEAQQQQQTQHITLQQGIPVQDQAVIEQQTVQHVIQPTIEAAPDATQAVEVMTMEQT